MKFVKVLKSATGVMLAACLATSVHAAFARKNSYNGNFTDIPDYAWYKSEVVSAYELGFVKGASDNLYFPDNTVTVAEAITMASRVHSEYNGDAVSESDGGKWYDAYVDYAIDNGIITKNQFDDYAREIKRYEMAEIFHDAMGQAYYEKINDVVFVPDVPLGAYYWDKLITLYNAGVVMGSDEYGSFSPDANIKRSECAAIINRVAIPENRLKKELLPFANEDAYVLCYNVGMGGSKEDINSGWVYDNRGGPAKLDNGGATAIGDVSEKYGTAFIREFNYIPKGKIVLETNVIAKDDGAYLEYLDVQGSVTYRLCIAGGKWNILTENGLEMLADATGNVAIRAEINLDDGVSRTYIANKDCGSHKLLSDNVLSYRVGMDEKGMGTVTAGQVNMVVNYPVYENFDLFGADEAYGWKSEGDISRSCGEMNFFGKGSLSKDFSPVSGKACMETYFIAPTGGDFSINLGAGIEVEGKSGWLCANGKALYELTKNMWYRLRVVADTDKGVADILLNGRKIGTVSLMDNGAVSSITINADARFNIDNLRIFSLYEYSDYVPEPTARASLDDFTVGLNICSLWRNGTHYGWACISAYDEPIPVIGMYDEGNPESADWEIKYMVEHGIDFQAFCWYAESNSAPLKYPSNCEQLHHGYMYAKYSDYMKYCILWEAANAAHFKSSYFRNYVIPYWFENYFLDPRYMTIDNKLVLPVFGANKLIKDDYFGSSEGVKAEFDYLEQVARGYGFDGVLFFACGSSNDGLAKMGFDAAYAYNWGTSGKEYEHNIKSILESAKNEKMYTIPTISVGFDSIPWHGERHGNMTTEDYGRSHEWVKNTYLPEYSPEYDWAENLVWLSTWNEYGEGTYIMPSGLNGFGYLDEVRYAYTKLPFEHEDVVPTLKQKQRITHLYPQYARLLRRNGTYYSERTETETANEPKNRLFINDIDVQANAAQMYLVPPVVKNGRVYFAFNPSTAVNFILGCHYEYRKDAGTLKIMANGHELVFKVGYDCYIVDGVEKELGYKVELFDNLVMLDFEKLGRDLEYKTDVRDGNVYIYTDTYDMLWKKLSERETGVWEFNNDYDNEGFSSSLMSLVTQGGAMKMTTITDSNDPISRFSATVFPEDFYTKKFTAVEVRCRYKYETAGGTRSNLAFYYITDADNTYDENKCLRLYFDNTDSQGEWVTLNMDLSAEYNWNGAERLTGLRFDPFNGQGEIEIDYIRFIEDPDFVYVPIEERPVEIVNGDIEADMLPFKSGNADITRVTDPDNKDNHALKIKSYDIAGNYTYFRVATRFKPYTAYKIDYDIRLIGNNSKDGSGPDSTSFNTNFRYADKGAFNDFDHIVETNGENTISVSDGWVHCSTSYVTGKIDNYDNSEFTIYLNPQGEYSYSFMLDNISVSEIEDYEAGIPLQQTFSWDKAEGKIVLDSNDGDDNFAVSGAKTYRISDGSLYAEVEAPDYDITVTPREILFDADEYKAIAVRFKAENVQAENPFLQVFFATDSEKTLSEDKSQKIAYSRLSADSDGYMTAVLEFKGNKSWKGKITGIRIDPANAAGEYYIDKVMLVKA